MLFCVLLRRLSNATTPLWSVPYEEQLKVRFLHVYRMLCPVKLCTNLYMCMHTLCVDEDDRSWQCFGKDC